MTDPDQTPLLNRIEPDTAKALAAYRAADLIRREIETESMVAPELTAVVICDDCTQSTCRAVRVTRGLHWTCTVCRNEWVVMDDDVPAIDANRHWRLFGLALAIVSGVVLIALLWPWLVAAMRKGGE